MDETVDFWSAFPLWRDPMLGALLAALLCAVVGVYIVLKRVVFVSAALSQMASLGVALSFYLASFTHADQHAQPSVANPLWYAAALSIPAAIFFALNLAHRRIAGETVIGLAYLIAGACVVLVLNSPRVAQEAHEVNDLLYGNSVAISRSQLATLTWTTGSVLLVHLLFRKEFVFVSFDPEVARTLGIATRAFTMLLFLTVAASASIATRSIGALPAFGFMVVPPAAGMLLGGRLRSVFAISLGVALVSAALGYYVSFRWSLPTGAAMVIVGAIFLLPGLVRLGLRGDT